MDTVFTQPMDTVFNSLSCRPIKQHRKCYLLIVISSAVAKNQCAADI